MNQNGKNHIAKLKELGVYEQFNKNLELGFLGLSAEEYCIISNTDTFGVFVRGAFPWRKTPEGYSFWSKIANS